MTGKELSAITAQAKINAGLGLPPHKAIALAQAVLFDRDEAPRFAPRQRQNLITILRIEKTLPREPQEENN